MTPDEIAKKDEWHKYCGAYPFSVLNAIFNNCIKDEYKWVSKEEVEPVVNELLNNLESVQKELIIAFFKDNLTFAEVCDKLSLDVNEVHKLEYATLLKLRHPKQSGKLRPLHKTPLSGYEEGVPEKWIEE